MPAMPPTSPNSLGSSAIEPPMTTAITTPTNSAHKMKKPTVASHTRTKSR